MVKLVKHDLQFILKQIEIAEAHSAGTPLTELVNHQLIPYGLRTVDGSYNNLAPGQEQFGSADELMQRLLAPKFNPAEVRPAGLHSSSAPAGTTQTSYEQTSGSVYDSQPRVISNLIVDQTVANPATVISALINAGHADPYILLRPEASPEKAAYALAVQAHAYDRGDADVVAEVDAAIAEATEFVQAATVALEAAQELGIGVDAAQLLLSAANQALAEAQKPLDKEAAYENMSEVLGVEFEGDSVLIPNVSADLGDTAPFNGFFTLFGQFFDHGLDLVSKGGSGTVYVPLQPDDPLYVPGSPTNFMALTRATNQPGADGILGTADDVREHKNETTAWIDLNQVYTSNPSHQVFLREYAMVDGKPMATGNMLEGANGGPPTWADVKRQAAEMLGIELTDTDILRVPAVLTDLYGEFVRGANGLPQLVTAAGAVEGNLAIPVAAAQAASAGRAFLNDIAHTALPSATLVDHDRNPATAPVAVTADEDAVAGNPIIPNMFGIATTYDDELLDAHVIVGDGRGNENIGLTSVHHLFHHEHNRQIEEIKNELLTGPEADVAFLNEWLLVDVAALPTTQAEIDALVWDGERLFQTGRFSTEMVYQHLVFEEFARAIAPNTDAFVFSNTVDIDPGIAAEFAHVVYRFGHSMLTEDVARLDLLLGSSGEVTGQQADDIALMDAFLNPIAFNASGVNAEAAAGAILRGMSRQVGNEIDEHVTEALRNNLLGLPLDLATLNLARARETGVPSLNAARRDFYEQTQDSMLRPYESWYDFALHMKNPASLINFIAAYGTHETILDAVGLDAKRAAATLIVLGGTDAPGDRLDFLNGTGAWENNAQGITTTGLDTVDFWIGGLAEKKMPFGGMLGSTFNFVFEVQMEQLQDGDRLYYLSRTQGLNLLNELEADSFAQLIMRNTDTGEHGIAINGAAFQTAEYILEMDQAKQFNAGLGSDDPTGTNPILEAINPLVIRQDRDGDGDVDYIRYTGGEHIVIGGTAEHDVIIAGEGDDTVWAGLGDDRVEGGFGVDHLHGGDGDDIITDSGTDIGDADVIHGDEGNDVINGGNGLDLIFGGAGSDFLYGGTEDKTISGGRGNDFIRGADGLGFLAGNEGDDWIEGGDRFDTLAGENSELFFNSTIIGHDVLDGRGNDTDYDAESGDDIMVQGAGIQRNNGMAGFDWAIHKGNTQAADTDMNVSIFTNQQANILRDRFDLVEGLSGWKLNDKLTGRDVVVGGMDGNGNAAQIDPDAPFDSYSNALLEKNVDLIAGLRALTNHLERTTVTVGEVTETIVMDTSDASDIMLGGGGSDLIEGKGGNDIIDGDQWLNVRILVSPDASRGQTFAPFSIDSLDQIQQRMFSGEIKSSQLTIVREIIDGEVAGDVDTAMYWDARANYAFTRNADGSVTVEHVDPTVGAVDPTTGKNRESDGTDRLFNVERLKFADGEFTVAQLFNRAPTGQPAVSDTSPTEGAAIVASIGTVQDPDGIDPASLAYQWEALIGGTWTVIAGATSASFTPTQAEVGRPLRVAMSFTDAFGTVETVRSEPTTVVGDLVTGTGLDDAFNGTDGDDHASGLGGADSLIGGLGGDTLDGGAGADQIDGGAGDDVLLGGLAADHLTGGEGNDLLDGGMALDTAYFGGSATGYAFGSNGTDLTVADTVGSEGADTLRGVERLDFDGTTYTVRQGTAENDLALNGTNDTNTVTLGRDAIFGLAGDDVINAGSGGDIVASGEGADVINGGAGNDIVQGGAGADTINQVGSTGGRDLVDGGEGEDTYVLNGSVGTETFTIYTRTAALAAIPGLLLAAGTEIVVARAGIVIAELDNIEEIRVNALDVTPPGGPTGGTSGGDTIQVVGDFNGTSLNFNTITIDGGAGTDTVDISALQSAHRIVFRSNGGNDTIVGTLRPQDVIELPEGAILDEYELTHNGDGTMTFACPTHSVTFTGTVPPQFQVGNDDEEEDDDIPAGEEPGDDDDTSGEDDDDNVTPPPVQPGVGTTLADILVGSSAADNLIGFAGDDVIMGHGGADAIVAGDGNDFVNGGDGRDVISANAGDDHVFGGADADMIYGDAGDDRLFGDAGDDLITGGAGNDTVVGGDGNDTLVAELGDGNDSYFGDEPNGGSGVDTLDMSAITAAINVDLGTGVGGHGSAVSAQTGTDALWGVENVVTGSGADHITASHAVNVMDGGAGNDTFHFLSAAAADGDTIVNFQVGDQIDLTGIDANAGMAGNQAFALVAGPSFTAAAQLMVSYEIREDGDYTVVQGNTGGDQGAEFKFSLKGTHDLDQNDFKF